MPYVGCVMSDFVWSEVRFFKLDRVLSEKSRSVSICELLRVKNYDPYPSIELVG